MNQFQKRLERLERLAGMGAKLYVIWLADTNRVIRVDAAGHGAEVLPGDCGLAAAHIVKVLDEELWEALSQNRNGAVESFESFALQMCDIGYTAS